MAIGIYILQFKGTDKVYIGKSINLESRLYSHVWAMRNGYASKKMHQAYLQFGEPWLEVLQECNIEHIDALEKQYILEFDSVLNGFNTSPGGEVGNISPGELNGRALGSNEDYITALELIVSTAMPVKEIADKTGLTYSAVSHICSLENHKWLKSACPELYAELEKSKSLHRNKYIQNTKRKYNVLISPEGVKYDMTGVLLKTFCEEHSLTESKVSQVLNGHTIQHKGWHTGTCTVPTKREPVIVISPAGTKFSVSYGQYTAFAKQHGLDPGAFRKVIAGTALTHHGWKLYK